MKRFILLLLLVSSAAAAEPTPYTFDAQECARIAGKYHDNPFSLTMGEYDTGALCFRILADMKLREKENDRVFKAIDRNFGKKVDGE